MAAPPPATANVKVPTAVIVDPVIGALKVALIFWLRGTLVAPFAGTVEVTAGVDVVVKVHTKLAASAPPAAFLAPVVIVAVNNVLLASATAGVNVAVTPA